MEVRPKLGETQRATVIEVQRLETDIWEACTLGEWQTDRSPVEPITPRLGEGGPEQRTIRWEKRKGS